MSKSSDPFTIVSYYLKWVTTSWTYSKIAQRGSNHITSLLPDEVLEADKTVALDLKLLKYFLLTAVFMSRLFSFVKK